MLPLHFRRLLSVSNLSSAVESLMSNCGQQQHLLCWSASSNRPPLFSLVVNHFVDTMGGADFCQFSHYLAIWVTPIRSISGRSPRVRAITFISQPPHLLYGVRVALDFSLMRRVVRPNSALYEISVRRPETLPMGALLSLHIRLPPDSTSRWTPLPSASGSCYRVRSGLSPPSYRPCRAHAEKPSSA